MKEDKTIVLNNENDLHFKLVEAIHRFYPHALLAIQAGELQDSINKRLSMRRKGYKSGSPDLLLCNYHVQFRGFAIELKTPTGSGRLSENQKAALYEYRLAGYKTLVSNDYDELIYELHSYFRGVRLICQKCERGFRNQEALDGHLCCAIRKPSSWSSCSDD